MYMSALVMLSCCLHVFRACGYVCLCDVFDTLFMFVFVFSGRYPFTKRDKKM